MNRVVRSPSAKQEDVLDDRQALILAAKTVRRSWPSLSDDPVALEALRGIALRLALYGRHPVNRTGGCAAFRCRWWRRRCEINTVLRANARADPGSLWLQVQGAMPGADDGDLNELREWLEACRK